MAVSKVVVRSTNSHIDQLEHGIFRAHYYGPEPCHLLDGKWVSGMRAPTGLPGRGKREATSVVTMDLAQPALTWAATNDLAREATVLQGHDLERRRSRHCLPAD